MALVNLDRIAAELIANGKPTTTPVTLVRWATTARQQVLDSDLVRVAGDVRRSGFASPATIVVGDVASVRHALEAATPAPVAPSANGPDPSTASLLTRTV